MHPVQRGGRRVEREAAGARHIAHMNEVALLEAVLVDERRPPVQKARREDRQNAGVRVGKRLTRTVDIEKTQRDRLESKKISKTQAVTSQLDIPLPANDVHVGPSDYVPWLTDRKWAHIRLEGTTFGGVPLSVELKLEVWDSPNSAGIVIDAVRCAKIAMDRKVSGALVGPSAWLMKSPPTQFTDHEARERMQAFVDGAA